MKRLLVSIILIVLCCCFWTSAEEAALLPETAAQVLENGYPVCPSGSKSKYLADAKTEIEDVVFSNSEEKKALIGSVYLISGTIEEHPVFEKILHYDGKTIVLTRMESMEEAGADYTIPEVGTEANFYLLYTGSSTETTATFYVGASERAVDFWKSQANRE